MTSLAIGDGANDVNMIIQANIGVGLIGLEGQQAARASDYALHEFQALTPLLLFHGRESYRKNTYLVHYNFYKNILLVTPQLWFGVLTGFSGTFMYDTWIFQLYNIIFTSLPIVLFALLDQQNNRAHLLSHPQMYKQGPLNSLFKTRHFWFHFMKGFLHALIILLSFLAAIEGSCL